MSNTERLEETKKRLEKNWSCLNKKLENVQRERILETRTEEKVRLDKEISDMQSEMREIEVSLEEVEAKLNGVSPKNHFALTKGDEKYPAMQSTEIIFYKKGICLNQQFEKYLVDTEITFQHHYKDNILLTDIYVYPHLKDLQEDIGKFKNIVASKKFFELDKLIGNYIIFAEEQLGKTSLSKMLFLNYFHLEALPLILRGSEIDKSIPDKLLERNIKSQYQSLSFEIFLNADVKKIVIIDDFDLIKLNSKYQNNLSRIWENISNILFCYPIMNLNIALLYKL